MEVDKDWKVGDIVRYHVFRNSGGEVSNTIHGRWDHKKCGGLLWGYGWSYSMELGLVIKGDASDQPWVNLVEISTIPGNEILAIEEGQIHSVVSHS